MTWAVLWRRSGVAVGYLVGFLVVDLVFGSRSSAGKAAWVDWTSTNLVNLRHHPVAALVTSGLYAQGNLVSWAVLAAVALGVANWSLGNWRTATVVTVAHVVGTLVSEGILGYQIAAGLAPPGDRHLVDVGPSYVVVSALVAGIGYGAGVTRLLSVAGFAVLGPHLFDGLSTLEVSSVGHLCSVLLGVAVGYPLWRQVRRRRCAPAVIMRDTECLNPSNPS